MQKYIAKGIVVICMAAGVTVIALAPAAALAQGSVLPGDGGRPGDNGVPRSGPRPATPRVARTLAPAPSLEVALRAAEAIAKGCKQYPLGVAVVNAVGQPILTYIPDGSEPSHTYTAVRKAYSAITFNVNTSGIVTKAQQDPEFAARIRADSNLMGFSGGILLKAGDVVIGAIGVSGAEPGSHDEECGMIGLAAIKDQLK